MDLPNDPKAPDLEVVQRVVAWHNRLPGARRIDAQHVSGLGVVSLPFAAAVPSSAPWSRVLRRLRHAPARFTEPLIESIRAARAAAFAWKHGAATRPGPVGWPLRNAAVVGDHAADLQWRYLRTAAVEIGPRRIRVLIGGSGVNAPVLGARHWNSQRVRGMLVVAAALSVAAGGSVLFVRHEQATAASPPLGPTAPREVAHGAGVLAASAALSGIESDESDHGTETAATLDAAPSMRGSDWPATVTARSPSTAPSPAGPPAQTSAGSTPERPGTWALATQPTRNRAATELRIMLINSSADLRSGAVRVEAVQTPGGWRAVMGPFASREAADQAREALHGHGVQLEPVGL